MRTESRGGGGGGGRWSARRILTGLRALLRGGSPTPENAVDPVRLHVASAGLHAPCRSVAAHLPSRILGRLGQRSTVPGGALPRVRGAVLAVRPAPGGSPLWRPRSPCR